ncbi:hypothetical protein FRC12_004676 [Ceratobasidium sp. 428]|nr:hypothetical protein FRC12_004676 [Ceratobasidium sp. 428]
MRFISHTLAAATTFLGSSLVSSVPISPKHIKPPEHLYSWSLDLTENHLIDGPLGTRVSLGPISGDLTDSAGLLIGHVVPGVGGETGIIDRNGNSQIDAKLIFQFKTIRNICMRLSLALDCSPGSLMMLSAETKMMQ